MKDINFYMNLDYPYEITPEEDSGYHAEIPLLPGCIAPWPSASGSAECWNGISRFPSHPIK